MLLGWLCWGVWLFVGWGPRMDGGMCPMGYIRREGFTGLSFCLVAGTKLSCRGRVPNLGVLFS